MSKEKIKEAAIDNANSIPGKVAVDKYEATEFEDSVKDFFKKHKTAKLKRMESTARGSELYDIDVTIDLPKEDEEEHAQKVRESGSALVRDLVHEFYKYLNEKKFKIATGPTSRGMRQNGDVIETTLSLMLANVPKTHRENVERIQNLIENVLTEAKQK